jgi:hypothetical protein
MKRIKINKIILILLVVFFLLPVTLPAVDFGFITNIYTGIGNPALDETSLDFRVDLWPRFSMLISDNSEFLLSAGLTFGVSDGEFYFIPEILHTEFTMRFGASAVRIGRFNYTDPLSFIAEGLFDGMQFIHNSEIGMFHVGVWYTGLLYKKNAKITMTDNDIRRYVSDVDFSDFFNTYFAPSRLVLSLGWEHPSIGDFMNLQTAIIGQLDFTSSSSKFHSQYFVFKAGIPFSEFLVEFGGSVGISQTVTSSNTDVGISFAGEAGFFWLFPSAFNSRLSFIARIAGGRIDNFCDAFIPITSKEYGNILQHKMSGISVLSVNYSSRLSRSLGIMADASYFIRNDLETFRGYPVDSGKDGYFLGPELYVRASWSPFSDLQLNLGGGLFIPALGNSSKADEKIQWRIDLTATLAIY